MKTLVQLLTAAGFQAQPAATVEELAGARRS
jgi:phage replication-related protein YjqB (UPF0714/DUF867 family)